MKTITITIEDSNAPAVSSLTQEFKDFYNVNMPRMSCGYEIKGAYTEMGLKAKIEEINAKLNSFTKDTLKSGTKFKKKNYDPVKNIENYLYNSPTTTDLQCRLLLTLDMDFDNILLLKDALMRYKDTLLDIKNYSEKIVHHR